MIGGHTVDQGMCAGCIIRDDTAHRCAFSRSRVGTVLQSIPCSNFVQIRQYNAWLNDCITIFRIHFDQGIQPARAIQDQRISNGLARQTGPCTARQNRDFVFRGEFYRSVKIVMCLGNCHALRLDLINRCIRTVEVSSS